MLRPMRCKDSVTTPLFWALVVPFGAICGALLVEQMVPAGSIWAELVGLAILPIFMYVMTVTPLLILVVATRLYQAAKEDRERQGR